MRQGQDPYSRVLVAYQHLGQNPAAAGASYYLYPPPLLIALIPLTYLPKRVGIFLWIALNLVALIGTMVLLVRETRRERPWLRWTTILLIACLVTSIVIKELIIGQIDILLTCLVVGSYCAQRRGHSALAGVLLALASVVKPYLGLLLLYLLWKRHYRAVLSFLLTCLACVAASVTVMGWKITLEWVQVARLLTATPHESARYAASLNALFLRLFTTTDNAQPWLNLGTWPALVVTLVVGVLISALTLRAVSRKPVGANGNERDSLEFALWVTGALLVFPELEDIHVTTVIVPLALLALVVQGLEKAAQGTKGLRLFALFIFLYFLNPLLENWQWADSAPTITGWHVLETGTDVLGLLCLYLCLYRLLSAQKRAAEAEPAQAALALSATRPLGQ